MVVKIFTFSGNLKNSKGTIEMEVLEENFSLAIGLWEISVDSCFLDIKEKCRKERIVSITSNLLHHREIVGGSFARNLIGYFVALLFPAKNI